MRIMWLKGKKSYTNEKINKYGWRFWQLKYAVDFSKKKGGKETRWKGTKIVTYTAYIQTHFDRCGCDGKLELTIFKDTKEIPTKKTEMVLERKLADLDYSW